MRMSACKPTRMCPGVLALPHRERKWMDYNAVRQAVCMKLKQRRIYLAQGRPVQQLSEKEHAVLRDAGHTLPSDP